MMARRTPAANNAMELLRMQVASYEPAGFALLQTSCPVTTAMAQKRCPESRSTVSSLALGVSWGIANLCTTPVGFSADIFGLVPTLNVVALFPWLATAHALIKKYSSR